MLPATFLLPLLTITRHPLSIMMIRLRSSFPESGITPGDVVLRTTDNEQVKPMATQVKNDLDALGFLTCASFPDTSATYAAIDADGLGHPACPW